MSHAHRIRRFVCLVLLVMAVQVLPSVSPAGIVVPGTVASAQETAPKPPTTSDRDTAPKILNYALLALLVGLVLGASMFPSKRGHQD